MQWLLTRPERIPLPNQSAVNWTFRFAAGQKYIYTMEWLLTKPAGIPIPDRGCINSVFSTAIKHAHQQVIE